MLASSLWEHLHSWRLWFTNLTNTFGLHVLCMVGRVLIAETRKNKNT